VLILNVFRSHVPGKLRFLAGAVPVRSPWTRVQPGGQHSRFSCESIRTWLRGAKLSAVRKLRAWQLDALSKNSCWPLDSQQPDLGRQTCRVQQGFWRAQQRSL